MSTNQIQVVSRNAIPPIHSIHEGGEFHGLGELRDFRWHDHLRTFMPSDSEFSVSWVQLAHGEVLEPHVHPIQSLMVFYAGSGEMLGDLQRTVNKDDVVVVPTGCAHGFVAGPDGLFALSIQLGAGLYSHPEKPRVAFEEREHSLDTLLAYNEKRLAAFSEGRIFELLADGTLDDTSKRRAYVDSLRIWLDGTRALLDGRGRALALDRDPVLEAITDWFAYQMYVLDDAEKAAIVHLVVERANGEYDRRARHALAGYVGSEAIDQEQAEAKVAVGLHILKAASAKGYVRLEHTLSEAWDMIEAMTDRVVELVHTA